LKAIPAGAYGSAVDLDRASYFLSTIALGAPQTTVSTGFHARPEAMHRRRHNAFTADADEYVKRPRDRTVIIGSRTQVQIGVRHGVPARLDATDRSLRLPARRSRGCSSQR
jgi:hypothetical protein